jgi:hypothetical protein
MLSTGPLNGVGVRRRIPLLPLLLVRLLQLLRLALPVPVASHRWAHSTMAELSENHREAIAGMDFFTVITVNFRILYCLFLIRHSGRESSTLM